MSTENYDVYKDQSAAKVITTKDLSRMAWRSLFLQASFNYERMQANGWLYTILPALRKIHKNPDDLRQSMRMHLEFFNTHPFLVTFISGLVVSMEEAKENISTIRAIKVSTMGPGGGIGDAVFWLTLLSICGGVGASFSLSGSWLGPIFFLVAFNVVHFALRFGLANYGYKMGVSAIANLKEQTRKISHAASIVGLTVIGAMTASYVRLESGLQLVRHVEGVEKPFVYSLQKRPDRPHHAETAAALVDTVHPLAHQKRHLHPQTGGMDHHLRPRLHRPAGTGQTLVRRGHHRPRRPRRTHEPRLTHDRHHHHRARPIRQRHPLRPHPHQRHVARRARSELRRRRQPGRAR